TGSAAKAKKDLKEKTKGFEDTMAGVEALTSKKRLEESDKYDFIFEVSGDGKYYVKTFRNLKVSKGIKKSSGESTVNGLNSYNVTESAFKKLKKLYPNNAYGDKNNLTSKDLKPLLSIAGTKAAKGAKVAELGVMVKKSINEDLRSRFGDDGFENLEKHGYYVMKNHNLFLIYNQPKTTMGENISFTNSFSTTSAKELFKITNFGFETSNDLYDYFVKKNEGIIRDGLNALLNEHQIYSVYLVNQNAIEDRWTEGGIAAKGKMVGNYKRGDQFWDEVGNEYTYYSFDSKLETHLLNDLKNNGNLVSFDNPNKQLLLHNPTPTSKMLIGKAKNGAKVAGKS
ncbi:MAG: hypothetical protein AABY22_27600, partial [Nanoarchaeota archaeon]